MTDYEKLVYKIKVASDRKQRLQDSKIRRVHKKK